MSYNDIIWTFLCVYWIIDSSNIHAISGVFQQRVNEAFSMYCDDEDTGKKVVFTKEHMEGTKWHI